MRLLSLFLIFALAASCGQPTNHLSDSSKDMAELATEKEKVSEATTSGSLLRQCGSETYARYKAATAAWGGPFERTSKLLLECRAAGDENCMLNRLKFCTSYKPIVTDWYASL